jgi:hypothetical protein
MTKAKRTQQEQAVDFGVTHAIKSVKDSPACLNVVERNMFGGNYTEADMQLIYEALEAKGYSVYPLIKSGQHGFIFIVARNANALWQYLLKLMNVEKESGDDPIADLQMALSARRTEIKAELEEQYGVKLEDE